MSRIILHRFSGFMPLSFLETQMKRGWYMFGVSEGDKLVGYASLSPENNNTFELHNITVLPECRHRGYGKMLLDHAKDNVRELGGDKITIGMISDNTMLKNWYTENGFLLTGTKKFENQPFTAGFMEWRTKQ